MGSQKKKILSFKVARKFVRELKIKSQSEWCAYFKQKRPLDLPSTPQRSYKNRGWQGWKNWLGYDKMVSSQRKYIVDHNFFKKWSYDMAYVLGFWFADGWINKNRFGIIQHKKDEYILNNMLSAMHSDYILRKSKSHNCYSIEINSIQIVRDIKLLGGKERKSLDVEFPKVPKKYLPDFIRGLWDGDGCVTYCKTKGKECYKSSYVCGSGKFINTMFCLLKKEIKDLNGIIYGRNNGRKHKIFAIMFGKNDTIRLRNYIYGKGKSNLKLIRKFNKFFLAGEIYLPGRKPLVFLSYNKAKKIVRKIGLNSAKEWFQYAKTLRPKDIHCRPAQYYKGKGWTNWYDWLGTRRYSKKV
jgi:hypothetical protein